MPVSHFDHVLYLKNTCTHETVNIIFGVLVANGYLKKQQQKKQKNSNDK